MFETVQERLICGDKRSYQCHNPIEFGMHMGGGENKGYRKHWKELWLLNCLIAAVDLSESVRTAARSRNKGKHSLPGGICQVRSFDA